jgi:hypothetical protein
MKIAKEKTWLGNKSSASSMTFIQSSIAYILPVIESVDGRTDRYLTNKDPSGS